MPRFMPKPENKALEMRMQSTTIERLAGWQIGGYFELAFRVQCADHGGFLSVPRVKRVEIGPDRVLFSVDSPYETAQEQSDWFDSLPISGTDLGNGPQKHLLYVNVQNSPALGGSTSFD